MNNLRQRLSESMQIYAIILFEQTSFGDCIFCVNNIVLLLEY